MTLTSRLLIFSLLLAGCGPGRPATAPVSGVVTVDGQPVTTGTITFYPEEGRPAIGALDAHGRYTLTTFDPHDGALVGKHHVTIEASQMLGGSGPQNFEEEARGVPYVPGKLVWLVPPEYAQRDTSPLSHEVRPGPNQIDWKLSKAESGKPKAE